MTDEIPCYTEALEEIYLEPLTCSRDILLQEPLLPDSEVFFYRAVMSDHCFLSFLISIASTLAAYKTITSNTITEERPQIDVFVLTEGKKIQIKCRNCRNLSKHNNILIFGLSGLDVGFGVLDNALSFEKSVIIAYLHNPVNITRPRKPRKCQS